MNSLTKDQAAAWSEYQKDISTQWNPGDFERLYNKWCCKRHEFIKQQAIENDLKRDLRKINNDYNYRCQLRWRYADLLKTGYTGEYFQDLITECDRVDNEIFEKIKNCDDLNKINKFYLRVNKGLSIKISDSQIEFLEMLSEIITSMREINTKMEPAIEILDDKIDTILDSLLDELPKQVRKSSLTEKNGTLGRMKTFVNKDPEYKQLTSFLIQPIEAVQVPDQGEFIKATLIAEKQRREVTFPPDCWLSNQKFLKALPSKEFTFLGSGVDVQLLRSHISSYDMPHKKGVTVAGFHNTKSGLDFVTEKGKKAPLNMTVASS